MLSIQGVYDGVSVIPKEVIPFRDEYEVVITFLKPKAKAAGISSNSGGSAVIAERLAAAPQAKLPRSALRGWLKNQVWMADDFNAPLEEMREYM